MNQQLRDLLDRVASTADFFEVDFTDVNATNSMGDNALHCVAIWGDLEAAKLLIEAGVNVNQFGDLGFTPLHVACMRGHIDLVQLLVAHSADLFAQAEGNVPFTVARIGGHDSICDYLAPLMHQALSKDRDAYILSRIAQLKREIQRLESQLGA
jgi:ankyrin repeat protein